MNNLDELVSQRLEEYNSGLYTLSETYWRLLLLVEETDQVDALIARLPPEFAAAWTDWARASYRGNKVEYFVLGRGPTTGRENAAIDAVRAWLARRPNLTDEK